MAQAVESDVPSLEDAETSDGDSDTGADSDRPQRSPERRITLGSSMFPPVSAPSPLGAEEGNLADEAAPQADPPAASGCRYGRYRQSGTNGMTRAAFLKFS